MNPKDIVYRGCIEALEKGVEAWKESHDEAMKVRDLEELIPYALILRDMTRGMHKKDFERLLTNKETATQKRGQVNRELNRITLGIFESLATVIRRAEQQEYEVERSKEFDQAFEDVRRMSQDFDRRWPLFDLKELEESSAQAARGEFASDEDVWRELQG